MEQNKLASLVADFQERCFKQWLWISLGLLAITACVLTFFTITSYRKLIRHHALFLKAEQMDATQCQEQKIWKSTQKQRSLAKKQAPLFRSSTISPFLTKLSESLPDTVYLTSLSMNDKNEYTLFGIAEDMPSLTSFITVLEKKEMKPALHESHVAHDAVYFQLSIA